MYHSCLNTILQKSQENYYHYSLKPLNICERAHAHTHAQSFTSLLLMMKYKILFYIIIIQNVYCWLRNNCKRMNHRYCALWFRFKKFSRMFVSCHLKTRCLTSWHYLTHWAVIMVTVHDRDFWYKRWHYSCWSFLYVGG